MSENVVWRTAGVMVKGNGINVTKNTMFDSRGGPDGNKDVDDEGSKVLDLTMYDEFSEGTCTCTEAYCVQQPGTCCVTLPDGTEIDSTFEGRLNTVTYNAFGSARKGIKGRGSSIDGQFTPTSHSNSAGYALDEMRDANNLDFRPKRGTEMSSLGEGAYSADGEWYWIPGAQLYRPSRPIPPNNAAEVKLDADLMFLPRRKSADEDFDFSDVHDIYVACSLEILRSMTSATASVTGKRNIVMIPADLVRPGKQLFWRVDVRVGGDANTVYEGEEWTFSFEDPYDDETAPPPPPGRCTTFTSEQVSFGGPEISSKVTTVSSIKVDSSIYPSELNYTLSSAVVCVNATFDIGVDNLQLRFINKRFTILKMNKYGAGSEFRACFSDAALEKVAKAETLNGTWAVHSSTTLMSLISPYAGLIFDPKMSVKNHHTSLEGSGELAWSISLCFDGWESPYEAWAEEEKERILQRDKFARLPWCLNEGTQTPTETPTEEQQGSKPTSSPTTGMPTTTLDPPATTSPTLQPTTALDPSATTSPTRQPTTALDPPATTSPTRQPTNALDPSATTSPTLPPTTKSPSGSPTTLVSALAMKPFKHARR